MNSLRIEILKDDVSERYPFWSEKRLGFINLKGRLLRKSIKRQLNERQEVWGVGLWPNEEIENAARKIAHIFHEEYGMPCRFIPDDPFAMIAGYRDGLDSNEALLAIEDEFKCRISDEVFDDEPNMTYQRFVEIVLNSPSRRCQHTDLQVITIKDYCLIALFCFLLATPVIIVLYFVWKIICIWIK